MPVKQHNFDYVVLFNIAKVRAFAFDGGAFVRFPSYKSVLCLCSNDRECPQAEQRPFVWSKKSLQTGGGNYAEIPCP